MWSHDLVDMESWDPYYVLNKGLEAMIKPLTIIWND